MATIVTPSVQAEQCAILHSVVLTVFTLREEGYETPEASSILLGLTSGVIKQFVVESQTMSRPAWLRHVRAWAQTP
jgi:hypothetical protein